ncbi:hypothetical protein AB0O57_27895 [Streptomyces sp. NPDC091201]|uniref:hypothetical protein n=1 Tax=Streptomyces sp. NPDC091201 TaxID=3155190 RepID=UPI003419F3EF
MDQDHLVQAASLGGQGDHALPADERVLAGTGRDDDFVRGQDELAGRVGELAQEAGRDTGPALAAGSAAGGVRGVERCEAAVGRASRGEGPADLGSGLLLAADEAGVRLPLPPGQGVDQKVQNLRAADGSSRGGG